MGVGACLIGEIFPKPKQKNLGGHDGGDESSTEKTMKKKGVTSTQTSVNQAMESMLAAEKKILSNTNTNTTNNWKSGLQKTAGTGETNNNGADSNRAVVLRQ
mmetsp:Transcript_56157/g.60795  ORF Transcript_56157/g.60795 Transcript_56157/m.60795 type:complete len:102 (-) Transcript_56157:92-397(-)